ncbi:MAG TPA: hypothetical protein VI731_02965 [Bacteroidia bacterium]|nr:hypothetical protein [Bacteroidia bacterium]
MLHTRIAILLLLIQLVIPARAQRNAYTAFSAVALSGSYGAYFPGGNLADRFGFNSTAGASALVKTSSNYVFGLNWYYLFGGQVKEDGILDSIATRDGFVIDEEGKLADIHLYERGFMLNLSGGKIFPRLAGANKNSGVMLMGSLGFMQHKIKIIDGGNRSPQLRDDYIKGYDRLTNGFSVTEFAGYWFMSKNHYVNFYAGFEFTQAFTKSRRSWDYDLMRADTKQRLDLLHGIRFGWMIPLYRSDNY